MTYRTAAMMFYCSCRAALADKCCCFFFIYSFINEKEKKSFLFFLSRTVPIIAVRVLWFLNDDSAPGGRHEPRDITWLVIFFCCWLIAI
jgi:hypothetical protein